MNNLLRNYRKKLKTLQQVESKMNFINQIRKPKLSDSELIVIHLISEYMSIDSAYQLFRVLSSCVSVKIERSVYKLSRSSRSSVCKEDKQIKLSLPFSC